MSLNLIREQINYVGRVGGSNTESYNNNIFSKNLFTKIDLCVLHQLSRGRNSFHNDIKNIKSNLIKNAYSPFLINKVIKKYLDHKFPSNQNQLKDTSDVYYFKLSYIGNL